MSRPTAASLLCALLLTQVGCSSNTAKTAKTAQAQERGASPGRATETTSNDNSLCDFKGKKDVEVSETAGPGAMQPNVRRVWKLRGTGSDSRKVLACREADTNLDGLKDVVRFYTDDGQSKEERADTNYDAKIDTWNIFSRGRLAEVRLDTNFDGEPDEWKVYIEGKLSRVKRDANFDKKPDHWEMYRNGRLERIGVDFDGDERVDRWDRDTEWLKKLAQTEQKKQDEIDKQRQADGEKRQKEAEEAAAKIGDGSAEGKAADGALPKSPVPPKKIADDPPTGSDAKDKKPAKSVKGSKGGKSK